MHAYEVEFAPARLNSLHITDAIRAERLPHPHVAVGDASEGKSIRIPLTARLTASIVQGELLISRAKAYRDPKSGQIVLGVEQVSAQTDSRALVLLAVLNSFPEGMIVTPRNGVALLARGGVPNGQQLLLIWGEGSTVTVEDPVREERYELRRAGNQFERLRIPEAGG